MKKYHILKPKANLQTKSPIEMKSDFESTSHHLLRLIVENDKGITP